jgi:uncharacterized protein (TIGR04255 family)
MQPVPLQLEVLLAQPVALKRDPSQSANVGALRFATEDGKRFVQLSKSNFIYQSNEPYLGWKKFRAKLIELWSNALPSTSPTTIVKVGLRYINRIVKTKSRSKPADWLQPTADVPPALLSSKEHFLGRIESSPLKGHLRLVTIANEAPGPDWPLGTIVMDIDRISTVTFDAEKSELLKYLELLHDDVWTCFDSAATKNLKAHLSGKPK